jgi:hypothetical protein
MKTTPIQANEQTIHKRINPRRQFIAQRAV